ncbi:MAG: 50S ribosomal protein L24 [Planctomycetes bacterium]|nr:50S ribosomal protein L24 [Planctomycetota bacterium]MCB9871672.1 50S ribosomal protein L24 [Planctomycetota bacterium]
MPARLKSGDTVVVISGADKSDSPRQVLEVLGDRVIVEGVNLRWRHEKPSQASPKGGRTRREFPIHASNVLLYSSKEKKGVRTRVEVRDGKRVRVGKCGTVFE